MLELGFAELRSRSHRVVHIARGLQPPLAPFDDPFVTGSPEQRVNGRRQLGSEDGIGAHAKDALTREASQHPAQCDVGVGEHEGPHVEPLGALGLGAVVDEVGGTVAVA